MEMIEIEAEPKGPKVAAKAVAQEMALGVVKEGVELVKEFVPDMLKPEKQNQEPAQRILVVEKPTELNAVRAELKNIGTQAQPIAKAPIAPISIH